MLETYVEESQCILIFLSKGYFFSTNCLRELDHAFKLDKPLVNVHETDASHGGAELQTLKNDCESKGRMELFERQPSVLQWQRAFEFQLETLKCISAALLAAQTPRDEADAEGLELYVPDELVRQRLTFYSDVVVYMSPYNPGAAAMAEELKDGHGSSSLKLLHHEPEAKRTNLGARTLRRLKTANLSTSGEVPPEDTSIGGVLLRDKGRSKRSVTHMCLYLNRHTFSGADGAHLAQEVRIAMGERVPIVMIHENDPERDGCPFSHFFSTTPDDIIKDGLYKKLAVACLSEPLRKVSLALIAREFGAEPERGQLSRVAHGARGTMQSAASNARSSIFNAVEGSRGQVSTKDVTLHSCESG